MTIEEQQERMQQENMQAFDVRQPPEQPVAPPREQRILQINKETGLLDPLDASDEARIARMMLATNVLPTCFATIEQVMLAVQMLRGLGIQPALGIRQVMVVNNALSIWGELPKAACESLIESFEEFRYDAEYEPICFANKNLHAEPVGALCKIKRRDVISPVEQYFTIQMANKAGLLTKRGSVWGQYPSRMLQMRARSQALKDLFPDRLSGVAIAEYDYNMIDGRGEPTYGDTTAQSVANEINALVEGEAA